MAEQTLSVQKTFVRRHVIAGRFQGFVRHLPAYAILGAWALFTAFTLIWIVMASFKTNREIFRQVWTIPTELHTENYDKAWTLMSPTGGNYFLNSIIIVGLSLVIILVVSAPASYILSRVKFRGSNLILLTFIAGIGVPVPLLFIPLFQIMSSLSLVNTMQGLIVVYVSLSIPFTVYMLTGFFATLPTELEESAIIDGCSDFQVFRHVMLPLAAPGILTAAIFNFIGLWNEFELALIFINEPSKRPLSLGLYSMKNSMQYTGDWVGLFAGVVIVMVPTIGLYILLSERMITGITMGAVK
jgi:ABC-type glycerol-3-phosphate transport system permease component